MNTCYNCIWFQEQVCMHDQADDYYWDGAENTDFAEECDGFDEGLEENTNTVNRNQRIDDWVDMSLSSL